jgi:hypothetical protein
MLLGGLWHGAAWTFVIWGGLHGLYLMINHGWVWCRARMARSARAEAPGGLASRTISRAVTLSCVILAWVFFRANSFQSAIIMLKAMFGRLDAPSTLFANPSHSLWLCIGIFLAVAIALPNSQELIDGTLSRRLTQMRSTAAIQCEWLLVGASLVVIVMLVMVSASRNITEFIYFNF